MIPWGLGKREKGDHSRFPDTELRMRLGGRSGSQEQWEICRSIFSLVVALEGTGLRLAGNFWCSWGLEQSNIWGSKVRIGRSVGFTREGREGCQSVLLQSWFEKVRLGLWEQKERRRSTSKLPGFPA